MVRIKVFKASQLLYWAIIIVVSVALIGLIANALLGGQDTSADVQPPVTTASPESVPLPEAGGEAASRGGGVDRQAAYLAATAEDLALAAKGLAIPEPSPQEAPATAAQSGLFASLSRFFFDVDLTDPASLLTYHLPLSIMAGTGESYAALPVTAQELSGGEELPDEGDAGEHIRVEIARITEPYRPSGRGKILIYHTHTYEAYEQDEADPYVEASAQWRTREIDKSIVGVGELLAGELTALGYEVVHDTTEFEPPRLGTAYERSLAMLERRLGGGEEYALIIDLHRDAWDKVQAQNMTARVGQAEAARLMLLIGTGEGSEGNTFSVKPNWKENYKLADALTQALNDTNPGLCREILVKTGRYNQHMSEHAVLIEVGNNRNTLSQAQNAMPPLALAIDQVLTGE